MRTTPILLGLTGLRHSGKSTAATMLIEEFGFAVAHPFNPGKAMLVAYYEYCGIDSSVAARMVYEDLKDTPHPRLPNEVDSRYIMERLGKYLGTSAEFGQAFTLGVEVRKLREENPTARGFIVESIVYEYQHFKDMGGVIVRMTREGARPTGHHSDEAQAAIPHDWLLPNNGDHQDLRKDLKRLLLRITRED